MNTTKPLTVAVALSLWLCSIRHAEAFYNPSTGRWLSRDPSLDQNFDRHQVSVRSGPPHSDYGFLHGSPPNCVDLLGLKTITFKVGGDDSGAIFDVFNLSGMDGQLETLRGILRKCKCNIQVAMDWDWAPHEGPLSVDSKGVPQWVFHNDKTTTDQKRLLSVFGKMGHGKIPVILTSYKLITPPDRHSGVGFEKEGIILEALDFIFWSDPQALSHELGHYAGYNGGPKQNKTHSSSNTNIMYYGIPNGGEPDEIYCTKVKRLAR